MLIRLAYSHVAHYMTLFLNILVHINASLVPRPPPQLLLLTVLNAQREPDTVNFAGLIFSKLWAIREIFSAKFLCISIHMWQ